MSSGSPPKPPCVRHLRKNAVAGYFFGSANGTQGSAAQSVIIPAHASPQSSARVVTQHDATEQSHWTLLSAPRQPSSFASSAPKTALSASSPITASGSVPDP